MATQLLEPRLAHIAIVDHPAHQDEGFIVAKALGSKDSSNLLEGLPMPLDTKELLKSLDTPLNKDNAADVISTIAKGLSYLVSKDIEAEKKVSKDAGVKEVSDTNEDEDDTNVTKKKADGEGGEMTMAEKAKAWDAQETAKRKVKDADGDDDGDKAVEKALSTNPELVAMKKQLNQYKANELFASTQVAVKKAAGALQTDIDGYVHAVIAAGGTETEGGKSIIKSLKATAEQLAVGGSFTKEIGANGAVISGDLKTANASFKSLAKALSAEEKIPLSEAFMRVAKSNPELQDALTGGNK